MPTVKPGSKVLVTGASGFIATWVVKMLLEKGFRVRGTVRSVAKGDYLTKLFQNHGGHFEYVVVEDMSKDGAFDEAVKGIDAVEHTASPANARADDPDEVIIPAVKGTIGILESVLKFGPTVKRVVITSSMAAIIEPAAHQQTFTENNWNDLSVNEVKSKGRDASGLNKYRASKALAEKAAWTFVEKYKENIKWDLTTLNPAVVWGPTIHDVPSASSLNSTNAYIYNLIKGKKPVFASSSCIDVRDLSQAHVIALENDKVGGERFLLSAGPYAWQDVLDVIYSDPEFSTLPRVTLEEEKGVKYPVLLDTTKARAVLGLKFRRLDEIVKDCVRSLLEREIALGW